jgi:hypothetical protein
MRAVSDAYKEHAQGRPASAAELEDNDSATLAEEEIAETGFPPLEALATSREQ